MNTLIQEINRIGKRYNIEINSSKTKIMAVTREGKKDLEINVDGNKIQKVENFTYLGTRLNENDKHDKDVRANIEKARVAFWSNR